VIDLHCHILPGIDDGPPDMEAALELARAHEAAGVRCVVATSHVCWQWPNDAATIRAGVDELSDALRAEGIGLEVRTGAEVALTRAVDFDDDELRALSLGGGPWLLVESPLAPNATGFENILFSLQVRGHRLVLAHPERCPAFQREPELLQRCVGAGMLTSVTAGAFVGRFGAAVQRFARQLAADGLVHDVASDSHDMVRRPPGMRTELDDAGLGDQAYWLTHAAPAAILAGRALPAPPPPPAPPAGRWQRLLRRA